MDTCAICGKSLANGGPTVILREKGSNGINTASRLRNSDLRMQPGQTVHQECRRIYVNPNSIAKDTRKDGIPPEPKTPCILRSESPMFDFKEHCLFCGTFARYNEGKKRGYDVFPVRTIDFQSSVYQQCKNRGDDWSNVVEGRLAFAHDLHAADAVYHQSCSVNFRTGKQIPQQYRTNDSDKRSKIGRPEEQARHEAFLRVARYVEENDDEQISILDLTDKMGEYLQCTDCAPYSFPHMKYKLKEHFGQNIVITELNGKSNVVTFRSTVESVLHSFYEQKKTEDSRKEASRMVLAAAKLIRNEIKCVDVCNEYYPSKKEMESTEEALKFLPPLLVSFLSILMTGNDNDLKLASIGQAIMQATRPRVILAPLQFGLSTQMHHLFASRFLVDTLNKHGFGCSYSEVQNFERCSAVAQDSTINHDVTDKAVQFVGDNVDHDIATLDGHGTFHGMGIVATITPGITDEKHISRKSVTAQDILQVGRIDIRYFTSQHTGKLPLTYKELKAMEVVDPTAHLDILWETSFFTRPTRPAWSGLMQTVHHGAYPGKSTVLFLPMIDMNASDMTCIFSTLHFVCKQAKSYGVTPVITFDQPLFWKATIIKASEPVGSCIKSMVLRLGGFHLEMSFLGSIGHLMAGSGLQELIETVYAANSVKHMLTGKAVSRAIRGHLLVYGALQTMLVANAYNLPLPQSTKDEEDEEQPSRMEVNVVEPLCEDPVHKDLEDAARLLDRLLDGEVLTEAEYSDILSGITAALEEERQTLTNCRTAQLWLQYMQMIQILCRFIKAERTGNWALHLHAVQEMLPYFAASGHNLYTKSTYLYLQNMFSLEEEHYDVYNSFQNGHHVIRRSDRYWSGLSTDLIIEQVLMRSVKSRGGLTRGRGMSETQRLVWLLSMPACAQVNIAMQTLTGVQYQTSEQHKDMGKARKTRDMNDSYKLLNALKQWNPFAPDTTLQGLVNGVTANEGVNVDRALQVGQSILESMVGQNIQEYSFKRKCQAVTLGSKTAVTIKGEEVQVDPQLLFQRLTIIANNDDNPADAFKYEMCSYPPALFESPVLPREANKASLADAMWDIVKDSQPESVPSSNVHYVIDGGALLQRLPWPRGKNFEDLCQLYLDYVSRKYGKPTIVFDGYADGPSIKDPTHLRRTGGCTGPTVHFTGQTILCSKKENFLKNKENKQRFLHMLSNKLEIAGCTTFHAKGDADTLIVRTAIDCAEVVNTVLVGDDTDLLVLLCYHADIHAKDIYFRPEPKSNSTKCRVWDIKRTKDVLGAKVCQVILFIHAILGCDSTSRVHGLGKAQALKMVTKNNTFYQLAELFCGNINTPQDDIIKAGEDALVCLYNGSKTDDLDSLRYKRYCEKVKKGSKALEAKSLPPTSAAARYHSLRVFLQISEWKGDDSVLKPTEWGWRESAQQLLPQTTDLPPALPKLLEMFHCDCKTGCSSLRCTCRKHGLECTFACGHCEGLTCSNSETKEIDDGDSDE